MDKGEVEERKAARRELLAKYRAMTEQERADIAAPLFDLQTVEGHILSQSNRVLLAMQAAARGVKLSQIGGFRQWKQAWRMVRKGERAFEIYFPRIGKDENGGDVLNGFSVACVFDVSQTEKIDRKKTQPETKPARTTDEGKTATATDETETATETATGKRQAVNDFSKDDRHEERETPAPVETAAALDMSAIMAAFKSAS